MPLGVPTCVPLRNIWWPVTPALSVEAVQVRLICELDTAVAVAIAAVVAQAININAIMCRVRVNLETDRLPNIDADIVGEALDIGIAGSVDAAMETPNADRRAWVLVLQFDRVCRRGIKNIGTTVAIGCHLVRMHRISFPKSTWQR